MSVPVNRQWESLWITLVAVMVCFFLLAPVGTAYGQSAESYYSKAVGKYIEGDYKASYSLLQKVLKKDPDNSSAKRLLPEVKKELPDAFLEESETKRESTGSAPLEEPADPSDGSTDDTSLAGDTSTGVTTESSLKSRQESETAPDQTVRTETQTETGDYPGFQPVDASERESGSPAPTEIEKSPENVVRHVNENYSSVDGREDAVYGLIAREYEDRVRFEIQSSGPVSYIGSRIFNPPMIIVDFPNSVDRLPESPLPVEINKIVRARHSQYRSDPVRTTRIVLDLEQWSDRYRLYRSRDGSGVVLDVFKEGADLPPETPMVQRVDSIPSATREASPSANLEITEGDDQSLALNSVAPKELNLRLTDAAGDAIEGETVVYSVEKGSGTVRPEDASAADNRTYTDEGGFARASFESDTQAGVAVVKASVPSKNLSVKYRLKIEPGEPSELVKIQGDRQSSLFGQSVPEPLVVEVRDAHGNPVPGVELKFEDLTRKGLLDLHSDTRGIQVRGETNRKGRIVVDHYRIASDVEKNRVRVQTYRRDDPLETTFLVYGQPQLITIDFKSANLQDVLRTLAQIADWNIALTEETTGQNLSQKKVTVHLEEVTALRALDTILDVKGLSRVSDGNVMKIVSKQEAIRKGVSVISPDELSDYPANNIVTVAYKLRFLQANQQLAQQLQGALLAENSSIVADESSNSLIVTDLANNLRRLKRIINTIDRQDQLFDVRVFSLDKRDPQELQQSVTELLPTGQGNVVAHRPTNSLLVYADPDLMGRIERIVEGLDTKNVLAENMQVIDVEGYNAEQLANRINTILGVQVIPVDSISFEFEESEGIDEILSGVEEVNIGELVNSAKILPLSNLEKIIVFGPENIRVAANQLVSDLKQSPEEYIEDRSWEWITFDSLPFEKARSLIEQTGGIKIQTELESKNAFLLSSQDTDDLNKLNEFVANVEKDVSSAPVEVYQLKHVQIFGEDMLDDFVESVEGTFEAMHEDAEFHVEVWTYDHVIFSTDRDKMPDLRAAVEASDTNVYAYTDREVMTYTPNYVSTSTISGYLQNRDLAWILSQGQGGYGGAANQEGATGEAGGLADKVVFIPKVEKSKIKEELQRLDSSGRKTYSYRFENVNASNEITSNISRIAQQLGINVSFTADPNANNIYFTTTQENKDEVRSLLDGFDRPGVSENRAIVNFRPSYVDPANLAEPVTNQNLGQVLLSTDEKISLLVEKERENEIREMLKKIDDPSQSFKVVHLERRQANSELIDNMQTVLNELGVNAQLAADPKTNSLLYAAPKDREDQVRQVIKRLDRWQKQVLIKAVLVEISLNDEERLNPQWIANPGSTRNPFVNENQFDPTDNLGLGYSLGAQGGDGGLSALLEAGDFLTVMRWIQESDRSDVVTRPAITALNNQEASIDLSQQRFFQTANFDDEGNVVATTFEPQSADKTLQVTPTITQNSNIIMDVRIANDVFGNRPGPSAPFPVNRRVTQNQVMVNDGQTIVLGGFIQSSENETEESVPFISDFPLVGNFFRSTSESTNRSELVVFLTPHVMETPGDIAEGADRTLEDMDEISRPEEMSGATQTYDETAAGQKQQTEDDTEALSVDRDALSASGERDNLNTIEASELRNQVNNQFTNRMTSAREDEYFTGWTDLRNRLDLTNQEIQTLQSAYVVSVPVVNVNQASEEKLTRLPGLSSDLASNIVNYRFRNGKFRSLEGLYQVFGMNEETYRRLEPFLTVQ